jgi:hypothetical protein
VRAVAIAEVASEELLCKGAVGEGAVSEEALTAYLRRARCHPNTASRCQVAPSSLVA